MLSKTKLIQSVVYFAVQTFLCSFCSLFILLITHQGKKKKASLRVFGKQVMIYEILQMNDLVWKFYAVNIILIVKFPH